MEGIYYGISDVGRIRTNNEDTFICQTIWDDTILLCAAIDGIGGNPGGNMAAEITRNTMIRHLEDFPVWNLSECLQQAVIDTNNEVIRYQLAIPKYREMGCVMNVGIIDIKKHRLYFANIGDTRIYTLQDGQLIQLTQDDAQGRMVTNYIGKRSVLPGTLFCKVQEVQLKSDSTLLFCTDGLWKMMDKDEISNVLSLPISSEDICRRLIIKANENGGTDNITTVVVKL